MQRLVVLLSLGFALACASKPPADAPAARPPAVAPPAADLAKSGLAVAAETEIRLTDPARKREMTVAVTYPGGAGPFPVIVFSPAERGSGTDVRPLLRFWATRGYVALAPTHDDRAAAKNANDPSAWENRARDLSFVIDSLGTVAERVPPLAGKLDAAKVGVGGHSYGAYTAGLLAGATVETRKGDKAKSFADPRPKAFLLLSPPGAGKRGWTKTSWSGVTRPLMEVTGSRDFGVKGLDPSWRRDAFLRPPPGDKYCLVLRGGSSLSFTGQYAEPGAAVSGRGKGAPSVDEEVAIFKDVKAVSVAFWDWFLKDDTAAKAFLDSDALAQDTGGRAKLERR